jgi:DNA-binding IclR family transcriptional regulator
MVQSAHGRAYLAYLDPDEQSAIVRDALDPAEQAAHPLRFLVDWPPASVMSFDESMEELRRTRLRGIARQNQEIEPWNRAIACPIFGRSPRPRAVIGIVNFDLTMSIDQLTDEIGPLLLESSQRISSQLSHAAEARRRR